MTPRSQRLLANQHAAARPPRAIVHHRRTASAEPAEQLWPGQRDHADFVARVKACTRLLELSPAHVVVAFALLRGELPRGGAR